MRKELLFARKIYLLGNSSFFIGDFKFVFYTCENIKKLVLDINQIYKNI